LPAAGQEAIPVLWKFGQHEMQVGYPAYRQRQRIGLGDIDGFMAFASPLIESYAAFLAANVPTQDRPEHWIAGLLPPVWQVASELDQGSVVEPDSLFDRTALYRRFNTMLESTMVALGFNIVRNFDSFLTRSGVIDEHYLVARKDSGLPAYGTTEGILATSLWALIDSRAVAVPAGNIQSQFRQLLDEIRSVQLGAA
jgi:hypothetical protein